MFLSVLNENQYFGISLTFVVSNIIKIDDLFYHSESQLSSSEFNLNLLIFAA